MVNERKIDHIKKGRPFSLVDIIAIGLSLVLCLSILLYSCAVREQGSVLVIHQSQGNITTHYDLSVDRVIEIDAGGEPFVVIIEGGAAYVKVSPCRGQDCVHMQRIRYGGQKILCAERRISLSIEDDDGLVAVS